MTRMSTARRAAVGPAVVALAALAGCGAATSAPQPGSTPDERAVAPRTTTVARGDITSVLVVNGTTRAQPDVAVRAGSAGALDVQVEAGERVAAGQVVATVGPTPVAAPVAGVLTAWHVPDGETVPPDLPVADLRYTGFGIEMDVPPEHAYRLYSVPASGTTTVSGGPGGLPCDLLPAAVGVEGETAGPAPFVCLLPADAAVMGRLEGKVGLETARAVGVLTLPVEAVSGVTGTGVVTRVDGTAHSRVAVELGVSDGHLVEIRSGLDEGDVVLAYAPGLGTS